MSAGIWAARTGLEAVVLEAGEPGGQLRHVQNPIVDYPAFPAIAARELADRLTEHAERLGVRLVTGTGPAKVKATERRVFTTEGIWKADAIILATGARDRRLGVPGEAAMRARGEIWSASRDAHRFKGLPVVVIGGGDRALEGAWRMAEAGARVTLVHRRTVFRGSRLWRERALGHPRIAVMAPAVPVAIEGERHTEAVRVRGADGSESRIPAAAVLVRIGTEPNLECVEGPLGLDGSGVVAVDRWGRTTIAGIYAAGDICTPPAYTSVASAVADGMRAVKAVLLDLEGRS